ncbi:MAG TPA: hypothetical protein VJQ26_02635, partial [Ktedonobacteraceae bacterium]|nr:hypothetical protein [Ktedonobacteraceae bacterium]
VQVQKYRVSNQPVTVDTNATQGAQIGVNLWDGSGKLITQAAWNALSSGSSSATFSGTTDDVNEGQWNLYFTNRRAQDAVGSILQSPGSVNLIYVAGTSISADINLGKLWMLA